MVGQAYFYGDYENLEDSIGGFFRAAKQPGAKLYQFPRGILIIATSASAAKGCYEDETGDELPEGFEPDAP